MPSVENGSTGEISEEFRGVDSGDADSSISKTWHANTKFHEKNKRVEIMHIFALAIDKNVFEMTTCQPLGYLAMMVEKPVFEKFP